MTDKRPGAAAAASAPGTPTGAGARRKNRLLRDFYGLEKAEKPADPLSMDDADFDAALLMKKVLAERDLPKLVEMDNQMVAEIRALDSDMKTLVYENYNKFISATETIKKMRANVENMQTDMDRMRRTMESIGKGSSLVNTSLVEKRNRINQLSGVLGMLRKLQFVFELPSRLRNCLKLDAYDQAYRNYIRTSDVLSLYSHLPSFAAIQKDCDAIIKELIVKLRAKINKPDIKPDELIESIQILMGLKEPSQALWRFYIEYEKRSLQSVLAMCANYKAPMGGLGSPDGAQGDGEEPSSPVAEALQDDPAAKIKYLNDNFCRHLADFINAFNNVFLGALSTKPGLPVPPLSQREKRAAEEDLTSSVADLARDYFGLVELFLKPQENRLSSPANYATMFVRMESTIATLDRLVPKAGFATRSRQLTGDFLASYVNLMFGRVQAKFKEQILALPARIKEREDGVLDYVHELTLTISKGFSGTLNGLDLFLHLDEAFVNTHSNVLVNAVFRAALSFWSAISADMVEFGTGKALASTAQGSLVTLVLARLCVDLEANVVGNALGLVVELFGLVVRRSLTVENNDIRLAMRGLGEDLLQKYVDMVAESLSYMIRTSIETRNWLTLKEPRRVSKVWENVLADIATMSRAVDALFEREEGRTSRPGSDASSRLNTLGSGRARGMTSTGGGGGGGSAGPAASGSALAGNLMIDRLFSEKIDIFGRVEFARGPIKMAIIKAILKTCVESVRLRTLGRHGYQQMQVDAEYIRMHLWRYAPDDKVLNILLTDIISSAHHRCLDPVSMDPSIVEKIASEAATEMAAA